MRRILDSSVGFKWLVAEADTDKALRLRDDFRNGVVELLAPDVFPIEIGHGLTRETLPEKTEPRSSLRSQGRLRLRDPRSAFGPRALVASGKATWLVRSWKCGLSLSEEHNGGADEPSPIGTP
jgi:hypothetical protein